MDLKVYKCGCATFHNNKPHRMCNASENLMGKAITALYEEGINDPSSQITVLQFAAHYLRGTWQEMTWDQYRDFLDEKNLPVTE